MIYVRLLCLISIMIFTSQANSAEFGLPGGPEVRNLNEIFDLLRQDEYDIELLLSFGTSSGGSAGHLALSIREDQSETVYSANFYADRDEKHNNHFTDALVPAIDKVEYIYGQSSTLSPKAVFGLDYGEIFKRSLIGVRVKGLSAEQLKGIHAFYRQLNSDYRAQVKNTHYHLGEIKYNYMRLNCAKTVAQAIKFGAGYEAVKVRGNHLLARLPGSQYIYSHTPTSTALNIMAVLAKHGAEFSTVLYKKFNSSDFYDDELKMKFKELPNRFPSFKSLDFFNGSTAYESYDNLKAMHLFYHLGRHSVIIEPTSRDLLIERSADPKSYSEALELAGEEAYSKSKNLIRRAFRSMGIKVTAGVDNSNLYEDD